MKAIDRLIEHIESTNYQDLPDSTITAAKTFILDSIGVGISGSSVAQTESLKAAVATWGHAQQAQVWNTGEWLPANAAAMVNGFQIHNQEWDCVHEPAVVHPMAVILSALMAFGQREKISGQQLILGVVIAVDVATLLGASVKSGLKFFRPSICGGLGAAAGIAAIKSLKGEALKNALGIAYSQLSGTMQAHVEGSSMLPLQIGINASNAINAVDMAVAGMQGPHDILEGSFGYFNLFEDSYDLDYFWQHIGVNFQIEKVSHKPFPTGRAGHGAIDGLLTLKHQYQIDVDQIAHIQILVTPLIYRLVGRPVTDAMTASYAKLCNGYIAATALLTDNVTVTDFEEQHLRDQARLSLGNKVTTELNQCKDLNALSPVTVAIELTNGKRYQIELIDILGCPAKPLTREQQVNKFSQACQSAAKPLNETQQQELIFSIDALEQMPNINDLILLTINNN